MVGKVTMSFIWLKDRLTVVLLIGHEYFKNTCFKIIFCFRNFHGGQVLCPCPNTHVWEGWSHALQINTLLSASPTSKLEISHGPTNCYFTHCVVGRGFMSCYPPSSLLLPLSLSLSLSLSLFALCTHSKHKPCSSSHKSFLCFSLWSASRVLRKWTHVWLGSSVLCMCLILAVNP